MKFQLILGQCKFKRIFKKAKLFVKEIQDVGKNFFLKTCTCNQVRSHDYVLSAAEEQERKPGAVVYSSLQNVQGLMVMVNTFTTLNYVL